VRILVNINLFHGEAMIVVLAILPREITTSQKIAIAS